MIPLTALYKPSMSSQIRPSWGRKNGPIEVHAETFVLRMFDMILTFSGLPKTSMLFPACAMRLSHCHQYGSRYVCLTTHSVVWQLHELLNQTLLRWLVGLGGDHVTDSLVEGVNLLGSEIDGDPVQRSQNFVDEWLVLSGLLHDEVPTTLLGDFDEGVTSHVLDTLVRFVHELEQLVHNSLEELPVRLQETGVLADNVHDVGCTDSFVVLSALHLGETEKILDNSNEEALFRLLICN